MLFVFNVVTFDARALKLLNKNFFQEKNTIIKN